MKSSLIILLCFAVGVLAGRFDLLPEILLKNDFSLYALFVLMFLVGISIGCDRKTLGAFKQQNLRIFLLPIGTILGTFFGVAVISPLVSGRSLAECLTVSSGMGYYSLSSILINQSRGVELGTMALLSNLIREMATLLLAPLMVRYFGPLSPISAGGATTADTTLPIIARFAGKEYVVLSVFHGICVDLSIPFLVAACLSL